MFGQKARSLFLDKAKFMVEKSFTVAVLVSTYNWTEALRLCLNSLIHQTMRPDEIVIADDGSRPDTAALIQYMQGRTDIPIVHVWHEDDGFRKTIILNKAIAAIKSDYILQVDGDVIPVKHFVSDHVELAERGYFVCGSRTKLKARKTADTLRRGALSLSPIGMKLGSVLSSIRSRRLRQYFALRYAKKLDRLRGCNMAFWRSDIIRINGYNEDLLKWGHEDTDLGYRLYFSGVRKKALKMGGVVYHLDHKKETDTNSKQHLEELERVKAGRIATCRNGIDKYLK